MDVDHEIRGAIEAGARQGLESLTGMRQQVFVEAYKAIGAADIASALFELQGSGAPPKKLLTRVNALITSRKGYSYESLEALTRRAS